MTSPFTNLIRVIQSLWACRVLKLKDRMNYAGFTILAAGTWPFYYRYSIELSRFGRKGISPYLGFGNYPLNKFFYFTESLHLFRFANNHMVLFCLLGWWCSHLLWITNISFVWISIIMVLALFSTTFLALLARMNYNVLGFLFFPMALYGLQTENWLIVGLAWFGASFGSFTLIFIGGIITLVAAFLCQSFFPILAFIPACLKLIPNFTPLLFSNNLKENLLNIAKLIGLYKGEGVRYKYPTAKETLFAFDKIYHIVVILQFIIMHFISCGHLEIYLVVGFVIFLLNSSIARFADEQSIWILILSLATCTMIQSFTGNYLLWLIVSYWILISPFPPVVMLGKKLFLKFIPLTGYLAPVYIRSIIDKFNNFFLSVKPEQKIFMAFEDPYVEYAKVFDGLRFHIEIPLYVALQKRILLFPDWQAVIETNYKGAPNCWGREPHEVLENLKVWKTDLAMIYQVANDGLEPKWREMGFEVISHCTWLKSELSCNDGVWFPYKDIGWWLIRKPKTGEQD